MADAVAYNFKSLFEFDSFTHLADIASGGSVVAASAGNLHKELSMELSGETLKIMQDFNRNIMLKLFSSVKQEANVVGAVDMEQCKPLSTMVNCAYTIKCIGKCIQTIKMKTKKRNLAVN